MSPRTGFRLFLYTFGIYRAISDESTGTFWGPVSKSLEDLLRCDWQGVSRKTLTSRRVEVYWTSSECDLFGRMFQLPFSKDWWDYLPFVLRFFAPVLTRERMEENTFVFICYFTAELQFNSENVTCHQVCVAIFGVHHGTSGLEPGVSCSLARFLAVLPWR